MQKSAELSTVPLETRRTSRLTQAERYASSDCKRLFRDRPSSHNSPTGKPMPESPTRPFIVMTTFPRLQVISSRVDGLISPEKRSNEGNFSETTPETLRSSKDSWSSRMSTSASITDASAASLSGKKRISLGSPFSQNEYESDPDLTLPVEQTVSSSTHRKSSPAVLRRTAFLFAPTGAPYPSGSNRAKFIT